MDIPGFERFPFSHQDITHDVFRKGDGRGVVITHELPGLTPACIRLAERVAAEGYRVYLPLLFGRPGDDAPWRHLRSRCVWREFGSLLSGGGSSPIVGWLRALCRRARDECGGPGVGVIGLCFTGNFAIALMAEEFVVAPVTAEPSRPLLMLTEAAKADLGAAPEDLEQAKTRAAGGQRLLGLRFTRDRLCPAQRFATLRRKFGTAFEAIEIDSAPGNPYGIDPRSHSVLTKHLVDEKGHPTWQALERVLGFLRQHLEDCRA